MDVIGIAASIVKAAERSVATRLNYEKISQMELFERWWLTICKLIPIWFVENFFLKRFSTNLKRIPQVAAGTYACVI